MKDRWTRYSRHITRGPRWHTLRMAVLERDGWTCVKCGSRQRLEVDHMNPMRTHPEGAFDPGNLQALCASCHTKKTRLECGHKPLPEDRQKWRDSVLTLMREGKTNRANGDKNA